MKQSLIDGIEQLSIKYTDKKLDMLLSYIRELVKWNRKINLISRRLSEVEISEKLLLPSLIPSRIISTDDRIIDFGAGAGIASIPLSILRNDSSFSLIDSRTKPVVFLKHIKRILSLNIEIINKYVRNFREIPGKFNYILLRGVDPDSLPDGINSRIIYFGEYSGIRFHKLDVLEWKTWRVNVLKTV